MSIASFHFGTLPLIILWFTSGQDRAFGQDTNTLANGATVMGSVTGNQVDTWNFEATELNGSQVCASVTTQGSVDVRFLPAVAIFNPDGSGLHGTYDGIAGSRACWNLPQTGTYSVTVRNFHGADNPEFVGNFTLNLAISEQPYTNSGSSGGLVGNGVYSGSVAGANIDLWSFTGNQNDLVTITMDNSGGDPSFVPAITIYDPTGADVAGDYESQTASRTFRLPVAGTYLVFASNFDPDTGATDSYTFTVSGLGFVPPPVTVTSISSKDTGQPRCGCADPVNLGNGNLFEQVTDYATSGPNMLGFTRAYNSLLNVSNTYAKTLGANWRATYDRYIGIASASSVFVERADGQILGFTLQDGSWMPDSDVDLKLTQAGSTWTLTDGSDTVETYTVVSATEAVLSKIQVRNGYTQALQYDSGNQLLTVSDSFGRSLNFTYQNGLLQTVTTPDSLALTYSYAVAGGSTILTSVAYSTAPQTSQSYLYEDTAHPFGLTGIIDEDGNRFTSWTYDSAGRATSSQHAGGADLTQIAYNDGDGSRTVTNALGQQTVYKFTTLQNVPKVNEIDRLATATTAAATRTFTYDANGYLASQTDWNGNITAYVNDVHGQPTSITEATGTPQARVTAITYDANFHLPTKIVEAGLTTDFVYDGSGNLLTRTLTDTTTTTVPYSTGGTKRVWSYSWAHGLLASVTGPRTDANQLTSFAYDGTGALIKTTNALDQTMQVTQHTGGGLPQIMTDANGVTTTLAYDARLRLTGSSVGTAAGLRTTTFAYDAAGNLLKVTLPDGSALTDTYDMAHRLTAVTDLFGQSAAYTVDAAGDRTQTAITNASAMVTRNHAASFDALGRLAQDTGGAGQATEYGYDGNGNTITITDPLNRVTQQAFDPLNRLLAVTDPAGGITSTSYDPHDRPLSVTAPNGAITSYVYDGFGDLLQTTSPDTGKTVYRYDLAGNLTQKVDAAAATVNYAYDALDRISTATYPADAAENVVYLYDQTGHGFGIGRLTSTTDGAGTLSRSYDERGNLLTETRIHSGATLLTSYGYDAASRVASIAYPSGTTAAYVRDAMGRITGLTMKPRNAVSALPVAANIGYQPFGPVSALTFGNGLTGTRSFDLDYRLTNLTDGGVQNLTYGYNAANDVLTIADAAHSGTSQSFGYDALERLASASGIYGSESFTYDAAGNRLTQGGTTPTTYVYTPQSNRLTQVRTGGTTQIVSYTPAGNITTFATVPSTRATVGIAYNQAGRLGTVLSGGRQTLQYAYDAFGQRLVKTGATTGTTLYQYDQRGHLLEESDGQGNGKVDYLYLGDRPVATFSPSTGKLAFLHTDRLGTPQVATDSGAGVVWNANYDPFGTINAGSSQTAGMTQDLRFPGQEAEVETGWNHNGFRDYVPGLGRYLESDPSGLEGGLNTYTYAGNNPINGDDPNGLDVILFNSSSRVQGAGHNAIAIGNSITGYEFYSKNGLTIEPSLLLSLQDPVVSLNSRIHFGTLADLLNYTNVNYDRAILSPTPLTTDILAQSYANDIYGGNYNFFTNNCADLTADLLAKADIPLSTSSFHGVTVPNFPVSIPNIQFNSLLHEYRPGSMSIRSF